MLLDTKYDFHLMKIKSHNKNKKLPPQNQLKAVYNLIHICVNSFAFLISFIKYQFTFSMRFHSYLSLHLTEEK